MTSHKELKPCPFCGGEEVEPYRPALSRLWAVHCEDCEIRGPTAGSVEQAIEAWNTRTNDQALSTLTDEVAALKAALVDHNDRLRSCCQVADRDGRDTNWKALRGQIHYTLAEHHEITNEARTSMEGQPHDQ